MRAFAELLDRLSLTASRNAKLVLLRDYLRAITTPSLCKNPPYLRLRSLGDVNKLFI